MFGFLEFEDDPEILPALLAAAEGWLRERGRDLMIGPMDFGINDENGVLVEGFDREPMIKQPWHPPYYAARCEEAGLEKAMDLWMWELDISDREKIVPIVFELAEQVEPKHGVQIRKMTRRSLRRDMDRFADVYNSAWSRELGLLALLQGGPRLLRAGDAARLRRALVHGGREGRRDGRGGHHACPTSTRSCAR